VILSIEEYQEVLEDFEVFLLLQKKRMKKLFHTRALLRHLRKVDYCKVKINRETSRNQNVD
jgi:hypothetical protein